MAYLLVGHSVASIIFLVVLFIAGCVLIYLQLKKDEFDFRAIISSYVVDNGVGKYVPDTSKTILVGSWITSSYLVIEHYSEAAIAAYLGFWVLNYYFKNKTNQETK